MIKTISKVHELITYKEVIDNLIYEKRWKKAIEEELQNLEDHHTWEYKELPTGCKAIDS